MNLQLSTPVYVAGAIVGAVMILTSIMVMFVQPSTVAQYAQNNAMRAVIVIATPTPGVPVVSSYEVVIK